MMNRKKNRSLIVLLLALSLCLSLFGCGGDKKAQTDADPSAAATPQPVISSDAASILPELPTAAPGSML